MAKVTEDLEQMTFHIPNLWDKSWAEAIELAEEPARTILLIQLSTLTLSDGIVCTVSDGEFREF
jgi:hypothetical protein